MEWQFLHSYVSHITDERPRASDFERHCHNEYEILFVLRGHGDYVVEGVQYPFEAGTLLLLRPLEYHFVRPSEQEPYERYVLRFDPSALMESATRLPFLNTQKVSTHGVYFCSEGFSLRMNPQFAVLDSLTHDVFLRHPSRGEALLNATITQILLLLSLEQVFEAESGTHPIISSVVDYINEHLSEPHSLESLSREFFISKYYLCRLFRNHMGMPPLTYLSTKRLLQAKQLIDRGTSASEAASAVGFSDYSVFYRAFRQKFGHSPTKKAQQFSE